MSKRKKIVFCLVIMLVIVLTIVLLLNIIKDETNVSTENTNISESNIQFKYERQKNIDEIVIVSANEDVGIMYNINVVGGEIYIKSSMSTEYKNINEMNFESILNQIEKDAANLVSEKHTDLIDNAIVYKYEDFDVVKFNINDEKDDLIFMPANYSSEYKYDNANRTIM